MVTEHAYAPPLTDTARGNIRATVNALIEGTGLTDTFISRMAAGDSAFIKRLPETSMNLRTYDAVMGRLSAAWPADLDWPASVPRPAPSDLPAEVREEIDAMIAKRRAAIAAEEARAARQKARELKEAAQAARRGASEAAGGAQAPAHA